MILLLMNCVLVVVIVRLLKIKTCYIAIANYYMCSPNFAPHSLFFINGSKRRSLFDNCHWPTFGHSHIYELANANMFR